jgi:transcriptional regulator with XRE-family HTH domain
VIGDALRSRRQGQHRTLREVSTAANVSLGYLSEIERGQKEASSELLAAICEALGAHLSELLRDVSDTVALAEQMDDVLVPVGADDQAAANAAARSATAGAARGAAAAQSGAAQSSAAQSSATRGGQPVPSGATAKGAAHAQGAKVAGPRAAAPVRRGTAPVAEPRRPVRRGARPAEGVRQVATDGTVSVSVHQETPLKATLRATRNVSAAGRGRDVVCAA